MKKQLGYINNPLFQLEFSGLLTNDIHFTLIRERSDGDFLIQQFHTKFLGGWYKSRQSIYENIE